MKMSLLAAAFAAALTLASTAALAANTPQSQSQASGQQASLPQSRAAWTRQTDKGAATNALNALQAHGYYSFSNFHHTGKQFEATVQEGGQSRTVRIDPATNSVTPED